MIFHLGYELPEARPQHLNHEAPELTPKEASIIKEQIRKNSRVIDDFVARLELFVNKEKYPPSAPFIHKIRDRLELLMAENDTFRKVLWNHFRQEEIRKKPFS